MSILRRSLVLLLPALLPILCPAAGPNSKILTSVDELAAKLSDPNLVLLHVSSPKEYELERIPGAKLVTLVDFSVTGAGGLRLEMAPLEQLRDLLLKLGVTDSKRVVIYPGNESVQSATRIWFTFDYLGWGDRASLLDGGLSAWKRSNRKVEGGEIEARPKTVPAGAKLTTLKPNPQLIVDAAWLKENTGKVHLIDARTPEYYSGASNSGMPRAGRIPGAVNVPFATLLDVQTDRKLLTAANLKGKLEGGKGELVTYCHIGQQATLVYFAARYLGLSPKLYDGSFQDWSGRAELPVTKD
jgi:thiosulfate/3-mercaptopyruvate sulfurtransferase